MVNFHQEHLEKKQRTYCSRASNIYGKLRGYSPAPCLVRHFKGKFVKCMECPVKSMTLGSYGVQWTFGIFLSGSFGSQTIAFVYLYNPPNEIIEYPIYCN